MNQKKGYKMREQSDAGKRSHKAEAAYMPFGEHLS